MKVLVMVYIWSLSGGGDSFHTMYKLLWVEKGILFEAWVYLVYIKGEVLFFFHCV